MDIFFLISKILSIIRKMKFFIIVLLTLSLNTYAKEVCSRIATVNYQDVLVDTSSSKKGEGLRFYLEKDEKSLELLNEYQRASKPSMITTTLSSLGAVMVISSIMLYKSNSSSFINKDNFLLGGSFLVGVSYLTSKTIQQKNEEILQDAINHYNRKNSPKIFFNPISSSNGLGIGVGLSQGF